MMRLPSFSWALHLLLVTTVAIIAQGSAKCSTDPTMTAKCFTQDSAFAENDCGCCTEWSKPDECDLSGQAIQCLDGGFDDGFPVVADEGGLELLKEVTCLIMKNTTFTALQRHHLRQLPNLMQLYLSYGQLSSIEDGTFNSTPSIETLALNNNKLTAFPPVYELYQMIRLDVSHNQIRSLDPGDLRGCFKLGTLHLNYNDLQELRGGVFSDTCRLQYLTLGHNSKLKHLDDDVFDQTRIRFLDLSHTSITKVPYEGIRDTLVFLDLNETRDLTHYSAYRGSSDDLYHGRTFPLLRRVVFYYSSLCWQMRKHTFIVGNAPGRRSEALSASRAHVQTAVRTRKATNTSLGSGHVPIEFTSCYSTEVFASVLDIEICPSSAGASLVPSPSSTAPYSCSVEQRSVSCRALVSNASTVFFTPSPTPINATPTCPDVCDQDYCKCPTLVNLGSFCEYCRNSPHFECAPSSCSLIYPGICDCSRKRSIPSDNCDIPDGYFLPPNSNSTDVVCSLAPDVPTPTPSVSVFPTTIVPVINPPQSSCSPLGRIDLEHGVETGEVTACFFTYDNSGGAFLRVGIYMMIVMAVLGNGAVIIV